MNTNMIGCREFWKVGAVFCFGGKKPQHLKGWKQFNPDLFIVTFSATSGWIVTSKYYIHYFSKFYAIRSNLLIIIKCLHYHLIEDSSLEMSLLLTWVTQLFIFVIIKRTFCGRASIIPQVIWHTRPLSVTVFLLSELVLVGLYLF